MIMPWQGRVKNWQTGQAAGKYLTGWEVILAVWGRRAGQYGGCKGSYKLQAASHKKKLAA